MNNNFSENMLKTYQRCPKLYKFIYEDNISIPQLSTNAEVGKNIHDLLNYYFKGFDISNLLKALSQKESELWENFLSFEIDKNEITESEYTFNIKLENFWLNGRFDAIKKVNNLYTILDWKTGSIPLNPADDIQTAVYLTALYKILLFQNKINSPSQLGFCYYDLKNKKKEEIKLDNSILHVYKLKITGIVEDIKTNNQTIEYSNKPICRNCNLRYLCI